MKMSLSRKKMNRVKMAFYLSHLTLELLEDLLIEAEYDNNMDMTVQLD